MDSPECPEHGLTFSRRAVYAIDRILDRSSMPIPMRVDEKYSMNDTNLDMSRTDLKWMHETECECISTSLCIFQTCSFDPPFLSESGRFGKPRQNRQRAPLFGARSQIYVPFSNRPKTVPKPLCIIKPYFVRFGPVFQAVYKPFFCLNTVVKRTELFDGFFKSKPYAESALSAKVARGRYWLVECLVLRLIYTRTMGI